MTSCPKCEFELPTSAAECPACGIVLEKYLSRAPADLPAPVLGAPFAASGRTITSATLDAFTSAGPWIRLVATCDLIAVAALSGVGLTLFVVGLQADGFTVTGAAYILFAAGLLIALLPLRRSAKALHDLPGAEASAALESFAIHQASFWHRMGVVYALLYTVMGVMFFARLISAR